MRLLLIGASAVALSGCAWMGSGYAPHHYGSHSSYQYQYGQSQGYYAGPPKRTHLDVSIAAEEFTGGNALPVATVGGVSTLKHELDDVYNTGWRASAGIHHDVAPRTTLTLDGFYKEADSKNDRLALSTDGTDTAYGSLTDYKSYGAEIGFREYATNFRPGQLRPYVGATVGAAYVEGIDAVNVSLDQGGTTGTTLQAYDGQWVPTASAVVGIDMPVSYNGTIGLESGLRYAGKRDLEFGAFRDNGTDAYSVPLRLRGRFRF